MTGAVEVRGSTTGPLITSALQVSWCGLVECLTGEKFWEWSKYRGTLPNFRQKSKGILKKN
ncbi:pyrimidine 2 [Prunus dulcis]|uniref:Pyrimidine 2 n=1 Tax=Prunus dulcis TaxID=3755 RepID=A0A5H2XN92_PRUDU|nr:pyrimidine 2 [Prunus dulcis]